MLRLLDQLLGPYVIDLSRDKLRDVGVWSGNVVLSDLELREDALDVHTPRTPLSLLFL